MTYNIVEITKASDIKKFLGKVEEISGNLAKFLTAIIVSGSVNRCGRRDR